MYQIDHERNVNALKKNYIEEGKRSYISVEELRFRLERCDRREKVMVKHKEPLMGFGKA